MDQPPLTGTKPTKTRSVPPDVEDLADRRVVHPQRVGFSTKGMVATAHYEATQAATRILEAGGNAVDAAVAAAFALGVCEPAASGLGGQTMMLIHDPKRRRTFVLDGSSRAPNRVVPGELVGADLRRGYKAATVPSTPATLGYALEAHGTLPLAQVLEPSIELAERGYAVSKLQRALTKRVRNRLRENEGTRAFLRDGQHLYATGSIFKQPALAQTLKRLVKRGIEDFYTGRISKAMCADMARHGGFMHPDDLANIPWPIERRPISAHFEGMRVMTMPPPGAGRTLLEMLNIMSHLPKRFHSPDTPQGSLVLAEVIRRCLIDRHDRPFDPNFYSQVTEHEMLTDEYAKKVAQQVRKRVKPLMTSGETTHLSAMDRHGMVVGLTQSIEQVYGACVATPELGFLYNDYMSAFEYEDISHPYYLRPNTVPWASVAPTIVFRGRKPWMVIGSPGSGRIVSSILQVLLRLERQSPFDAVAAPRMHCSLEGVVSLEATRMRSDIPAALKSRGFKIDRREPYSFYLGCIQLVMAEGDGYVGVADPRRDGSALGP